jgi:hypothetical protein
MSATGKHPWPPNLVPSKQVVAGSIPVCRSKPN